MACQDNLINNNMKTTLTIAAELALLTLLAGCVVTSVYPFYTARDIVFDPALLGAWAETGSTNASDERWQFERTNDQAYRLTVQDSEKRTEYDTHLFKLKGQFFLDLCPRERPENALPLHYLFKVTRLEPTLELNLLDYDWLKKVIEKDAVALRHIIVPKKLGETGDGDLVLTADTAALQKFILKHQKTEGAFCKGLVLNRWQD
jgi:hypothetical protein